MLCLVRPESAVTLSAVIPGRSEANNKRAPRETSGFAIKYRSKESQSMARKTTFQPCAKRVPATKLSASVEDIAVMTVGISSSDMRANHH